MYAIVGRSDKFKKIKMWNSLGFKDNILAKLFFYVKHNT